MGFDTLNLVKYFLAIATNITVRCTFGTRTYLFCYERILRHQTKGMTNITVRCTLNFYKKTVYFDNILI